MFDDISSVALHSAMSGLAARQRAIADNIANIQTPGFQASKVAFEDALHGAVANGSGRSGWSVARSLEPTRTDGNNVNLDEETLSNIDTNMRYQLVTQAMSDKFTLLSTSMRTS